MGLFDFFKKRKSLGSDKVDKHQNEAVSIFTPKFSNYSDYDDTIIPVEKRLETAIASKQGLYPHEILVLSYAHTFYTDEDSFQKFWWTKYGVTDAKAILLSLQERGFLQISDLRSTLEKQTVTDIKEILKASNSKTTGKKLELVQRVLDELPENEINERFPRRTYGLTEYGKIALDESAYIPYIHRKNIEDLDIWSLNRLVNSKSPMSFKDKIWEYLNKQSIRHFSKNDFGLYRNCRFSMAQFLMDEKKYLDALSMLAEVVFYDLSDCSNNYNPDFLQIYAKSFFPYENSSAKTAPGIVSTISSCQKELQFSDDELKATLIERMSKLTAPLQLFTVEECAQIVIWEREQQTQELMNVYDNAKLVFEQNHPNIKV